MLMKLHFVMSEWVENRALSLHMVSGTGVTGYDQSGAVEPLRAGSRFTFEEHLELPYGVLGSLIGKVGQHASRSPRQGDAGGAQGLEEA